MGRLPLIPNEQRQIIDSVRSDDCAATALWGNGTKKGSVATREAKSIWSR